MITLRPLNYFLLWSFFTAVSLSASEWPSWRGPEGNGISLDKNLPWKWDKKENVQWRVDLPGPGNASPIVWGDRVFVPQYVAKETRRTLMCFERSSGKLIWQSGITYSDQEPTQESNPYCAGTPATDGERVFVSFGSAGVFAFDFSGKEIWRRELGKLTHMFGNAISPVLFGNLCIIHFGPDEKARIVALKKDSGEIAWEINPPPVDPSEQQSMGGGPGGPGGPRGFGPGMMLAPQLLSQGDKNSDEKLSRDEFTALADSWYDKLDLNKTGKLSQDEFTLKLADVLPSPAGFGPPDGEGGDRGPRGGRGMAPSRMVGPGLFAAADSDKDGSLTRPELKATFSRWATDWDTNKLGLLNEEQLREGLNAALPRPDFGGPGGPGGGRGPGGRGGRGGGGGSWSTPIVLKSKGHDELVVNFPSRLAGYDLQTGKQLWMSKGLGGTIYSTPVSGEGVVVGMSSGMGQGSAIAVRPGGLGDVSESQRVWKLDRVKSGMGSGVIHDGHFFNVSSEGIAACLDLKDGHTVWEERLKGSGARGSSWSSILLADGKIYVPNQAGDVFVLRAGPTFEILATNVVGEPTNASLAASNNELFLRTNKGLWCFANAK